jgi:hypothetical protein
MERRSPEKVVRRKKDNKAPEAYKRKGRNGMEEAEDLGPQDGESP